MNSPVKKYNNTLTLVSEKKSRKPKPACNQKTVMKIVSEGGVPVLKSEKKNEYKTSGKINMLFTEQLILLLTAQIIGNAAIATSSTLHTMQLSSTLKNTVYIKYATEKISINVQAISKLKSFFWFWDF